MYNSVQQIIYKNKGIGHHFFSHGAIQFFNSRVLPGLYQGCYFITSERFDLDSPRRFTIRMAREGGEIETVYGFQKFITAYSAKKYIERLPAELPEAYELASRDFSKGTRRFLEQSSLDTPTGEACRFMQENLEELDWNVLSNVVTGKQEEAKDCCREEED